MAFLKRFSNSSERTRDTVNNIVLSLLSRGANIIAHILVVPLTISYLNVEKYGIWLTLSSIIGWISFFDLGLGHGFRNRFAEAKAKGDNLLARQYVSTTYFYLSCIIISALVIILICNHFVNWANILNVNLEYKEELTFVFSVIIIFTSLNMITNIFVSLLSADQKVGKASVIQAIGQYLSLLSIYVLTKVTSGSLTNLALYYSGIPCIVMGISSIIYFHFGNYRKYKPSLSCVSRSLLKNIMNLGVQFFLIQISMIAIFQIVNIVISRELGPESVTIYNISNKYYNVVYMTATIAITPFWSAFTDAYAKQDFDWMNSVYRKLQKSLVVSFFVYLFMFVVSNYVYRIWIGNDVVIPNAVSASMVILVFIQTYCAINTYIINGLGAVRIQAIIFCFFALIAWLIMPWSCSFGLTGIIMFTAGVYFVLGLFGNIQVRKILSRKAKGIWLK